MKSFRQYLQLHKNEDLGLTSEKLINNLTFLIDVQEYKVGISIGNRKSFRKIILFIKELCQKQADDITLLNKVNHIVDSYINNAIPPKIQIDINSEVAQKIIDECDFLSPYLFLEAYVSIFLDHFSCIIEEHKLICSKNTI